MILGTGYMAAEAKCKMPRSQLPSSLPSRCPLVHEHASTLEALRHAEVSGLI